MKNILLGIVAVLIMTACSDERLYQMFGSPPPQGPPTIYPLNFPVCPTLWGIVVVPLRIVIYKNGFPNAEHVMHLRKRNPGRNICDVIRERYDRSPFRFEKNDHWEGVGGLGKSGNGYFVATSYEFNLMNDESFRKKAEGRRKYEEFQQMKLARDGYADKRFIESEETLTINGLKWRHQVIAIYDGITSFDPKHPRKISNRAGLFDLYEHRFDKSHVFQIQGFYDSIILTHPEVLEDRRRMTRRLVDGFRYERISQERLDELVKTYGRKKPAS